jgi:hypothetical protein
MQIATAMPTEDRFHQHLLHSPYANTVFLTNNVETDSMAADMPGMTPDHAEAAMSDRSTSPLPNSDLCTGYSFGDEGAPNPGVGDNGLDGDEASRVDEPYARLIFRAFMSRERHAMTLQEIYQWFRENTDKAKTENKGWQNSIRHNLSMNAVRIHE